MKPFSFFRFHPYCVFLLSNLLMFLFSLPPSGMAQTAEKPGAPRFILPENADAESLPLLSVVSDVDIAGIIAHVSVKQVYRNRGSKPIEAVYIFPGSTRAAVHALKMTIGERVVVAKIEERNKARQEYTRAVEQGQTASLLEQHRPNVFQMSVGNILPGDLIEVELQYTETLLPSEGRYEFVFPAVVGPRYTGKTETGSSSEGWTENPYTNEGELPAYTFELHCNISSAIPVKNLRSTSHKINTVFRDKNAASVLLDKSETYGGNRDFILHYTLGGNRIESGVWLYNDGSENYFLACIQPPDVVKPELIPPREYIFIVDVSGSMFGFPLEVSKKLISDLLSGLKSTDRFNILFFAGGSNLLSESSVPASPGNIARAMKMLSSQSGGGGTELLPALRRALSLELSDEFARTFVVATDGFVTVEKEAFSLIRTSLGEANFFAFGIGSSVNRYLIEGMARAGSGEAFVVTGEKEAGEIASAFRKYISSPVLTGIEIDFKNFDAFDVQPSAIPDVFQSRPVMITGKFRGEAKGSIVLKGSNGAGAYSQTVDLAGTKVSSENKAIRYLWAREQIRVLDDYQGDYTGVPDDLKERVTRLGISHNLLTAYTSFVAIDSSVRNNQGGFVTVNQPLPLPEGVSNLAIGSSASGRKIMGINAPSSPVECRETTMDLEPVYQEEVLVTEFSTAPEFPGGESALENFLKEKLVMPEPAKQNAISGKVVLKVTIGSDGKIGRITVMKPLGYGCDEEAIRIARAMPAWKPATKSGKAIKAEIVISIGF